MESAQLSGHANINGSVNVACTESPVIMKVCSFLSPARSAFCFSHIYIPFVLVIKTNNVISHSVVDSHVQSALPSLQYNYFTQSLQPQVEVSL